MNKNRYEFYKRLFPNKLIIYENKNKFTSIGIDKEILKNCKIENISRVVIDNDDNVKVIEVDDNKYKECLLRISLELLIKEIFKKVNGDLLKTDKEG